MCYLAFIAVPAQHADEILRPRAGRGVTLTRSTNPSSLAIAGPGRAALEVTAGGCACGLYVHPTEPSEAHGDDRIAAAEAKYRKQGWSKAKIDRALEGMRAAHARRDRFAGFSEPVVTLARSLTTECGKVSVWVHFFRGLFAEETYTAPSGPKCTLAEFDQHAASLKPDCVLTITRD